MLDLPLKVEKDFQTW